jgi:hypothetical protein
MSTFRPEVSGPSSGLTAMELGKAPLKLALTIREFCSSHNISPAFFYLLQATRRRPPASCTSVADASNPLSRSRHRMNHTPPATHTAVRRRCSIIIPKNEKPRCAATRHRGRRSSKHHDQYVTPWPIASAAC